MIGIKGRQKTIEFLKEHCKSSQIEEEMLNLYYEMAKSINLKVRDFYNMLDPYFAGNICVFYNKEEEKEILKHYYLGTDITDSEKFWYCKTLASFISIYQREREQGEDIYLRHIINFIKYDFKKREL